MKFELSEHRELKGIPSASGLEITDTGIYIIGDDSPYLFKLNNKYEVLDKIRLFPQRDFGDSIIEKILKPDLEALTKGNEAGEILLSFGSGSKSPERDIMVEIDLSTNIPTEYSLTEFYSQLRTYAGLTKDQLNIEAAEVYQNDLFLFNRGENLIVKCNLPGFMAYLKENGEMPNLEVYRIGLPDINGISSGFSGASLDPENGILFFTATVEDTDNWIDDGEVLGSFIGHIKIKDLEDGIRPDHIALLLDKNYLRVKVESIAVLSPFQEDRASLLMVTDSDGGISEILSGTLFY